jgi:hypothetical protein
MALLVNAQMSSSLFVDEQTYNTVGIIRTGQLSVLSKQRNLSKS